MTQMKFHLIYLGYHYHRTTTIERWLNIILAVISTGLSNFTYRDALEVGAYLIETGKFERVYKEMQIYDLQKELEALDD